MASLCDPPRLLSFAGSILPPHLQLSRTAPSPNQLPSPRMVVLCSTIEVDYSKKVFKLKQQGIDPTPKMLRRLWRLEIWKKRRRDRKEKEKADKVTHPLWYPWSEEESLKERVRLDVEEAEQSDADDFLCFVKDQRPARRVTTKEVGAHTPVRKRRLRLNLPQRVQNNPWTRVNCTRAHESSCTEENRDRMMTSDAWSSELPGSANRPVTCNTLASITPNIGLNTDISTMHTAAMEVANIAPMELLSLSHEAMGTSKSLQEVVALSARVDETVVGSGSKEKPDQRTELRGGDWDAVQREHMPEFVRIHTKLDKLHDSQSHTMALRIHADRPRFVSFETNPASRREEENEPTGVERFFVDEDSQREAEVWIKGLGRVNKIKPPFSQEFKEMIISRRKGDWKFLLEDDLASEESSSLERISTFDFDGRAAVAEDKKIQLLAARLKETDYWTSKVLFRKVMHSGRIKLTEDRVLRLVQILGDWGNWRRAMQVVQWVHKRQLYRFQKSRYVMTTLLAVLGKAHRPVEALRVLNVMRESFSSYPDMAAYHVIAVTLGQSGRMKELLEVIESLRKGPTSALRDKPAWNTNLCLHPDIVIYNAVLNACISGKEWSGVQWAWQEIYKCGIQPNGATYGLTIEAMVKAGNFDDAIRYHKRMERAGFPSNAQTFRCLIEIFGKAGKLDEAIELFNNMEASGIVVTASVHIALARSFCIAGRIQDALSQVEKAHELSSRKPDVITYTGLIRACHSVRNVQNAIFLFEHMQKHCAPNVDACNEMIKIYGTNKMFEEARLVFEAVKRGWLGAQEHYRGPNKLRCNPLTYELMLKSSAISGQWDYFDGVYELMIARGYHLSGRTSLWLMVKAADQGKIDMVDDMIQRIRKGGEVPDKSLYEAQMLSCLRQDRKKEVMSYLADMEADGLEVLPFLQRHLQKST